MPDRNSVDVAKIHPGPVLLLAGPGTGKTHQLARRVKFLIEDKHVHPNDISVITFTGQAARNMRRRLSDEDSPEVYVPPEQQPANIRTMHSLGYKIVSDAYRKVGLRKGFTVLDPRLRSLLFADSARMLGFSGDDAGVAERCRRLGKCEQTDCEKCRICDRYKDLLRGLNAIDYDDQIFLACTLLESNGELLKKWQQVTRHLLVDEYQDINQAQYEFIRLLSRGQEDGLFAVGDDDQSIYSWRGGSPIYVVNFSSHLGPSARVETLKECRRCPAHVLHAALALVSKNNDDRLPKDGLRSIKTAEYPKVAVFEVPSDKYEAKMICSTIAAAPMTQDALVLVPGHRFAVPIKRQMRRRGIAYDCKTNVVESGLNAMNDLVKWLRRNTDSLSLRLCLERIVTNPCLKIPFEEAEGIKARRERTLAKIASLWPRVVSDKSTLYTAFEANIDGSRDLQFIAESLAQLKAAWEDKSSENAGRFLETVSRILRPWTSPERCAEEIEEWVEDAVARDASSGDAIARVLTMEAAKGLGSDQVFVVGLNEKIFPPENLGMQELREKQRLLYVSMTRAKRTLQMFSARTREGRFSYQAAPDGRETGTLKPSPFLAWLPQEDVTAEKKWPYKR
jgi:superfamily I DNA/RNA helicase